MGSLTPTTIPGIPIPTSLSLLNRTAIVTGGTRGIGKGIALELARRGANVAIVYANPKNGNRAQETIEEIEAIGKSINGIGAKGREVKAVAILADLKDPSVGDRIIKETLEGLRVREVNILVHNAAIASMAPTAELNAELFSDIFDTNVRGPVLLTKAALPFISPGGRIILLSSIVGRQASPGAPVPLYAASKGAVESLARTWAFEFGQSLGITVNAVAPGLVATEILDIIDPKVLDELRQENNVYTPAAPRFGTVDDIAQIVAFIASDSSRWISGSTIFASGGKWNF